MIDNVEIYFIANCAFLVKYGDHKMLFDGIYQIKNGLESSFSNIPQELSDKIFTNSSEFKDIEYLVFTHKHYDHYDKDLVSEYSRMNKTKIILPDENSTEKSILIQEDWFNLKGITTEHDGDQFVHYPHYSYLLTINKKRLLFTGDLNPYDEKVLELCDKTIDCLFINFLSISRKEGRNLVNKINPAQIAVQHLPFQEGDTYRYLNMTNLVLKKNPTLIPKTTIFKTTMQKLIF